MTRGEVEQYMIKRVDNGDKEKKKKRRSTRRSKQSASSVTSASCSSINEINGAASGCLKDVRIVNHGAGPLNDPSLKECTVDTHSPVDDGQTSEINVSFSSLPTMYISEQGDIPEMQISKNQHFSSNYSGSVVSKSCSQLDQGVILDSQIAKNERVSSNAHGSAQLKSHSCDIGYHGPYTNHCLSPPNQVDGHIRKKYFSPHWSMDAINGAIQKGDVFKAIFRVNAYNKLEAYCKIEGVPTDILVNGISLQNRAVEGDVVAVKVDPVMLWTKMRGSIEVSNDEATGKDNDLLIEDNEIEVHKCKGKCKSDGEFECSYLDSQSPSKEEVSNECQPLTCDNLLDGCHFSNALKNLCDTMSAFPLKRPTGRVVAIIERSCQRDTVVGYLNIKAVVTYVEYQKEVKKNNVFFSFSDHDFIQLTPTNPRFPEMMVFVRDLPDCIKKRLEEGDATVKSELVGVRIGDWAEESSIPQAQILHIFGRGGKIESHVNAILFENNIRTSEFSSDLLPWLPHGTWEVPLIEYHGRKDLRNLCIFTIDPATATDLDDALSVEVLANNVYRVGVHIADLSYFVLPDTALDMEAQMRTSNVYLVDREVPMLPPLVSENMGSLNPGENRLAFSLLFDLDHTGDLIDRWIGHTVMQSCCKLSYEHAQYIIDGLFDAESSVISKNVYPQLHGQFQWHDVITSVKILNDISKALRKKRFSNGALQLESSRVVFVLDECGIPYDSMLCEWNDSNFLVEEFMLLANTTAAEVIYRAFPDSALLRRHPEPNIRKLKEFEAFCLKHNLELDASSSGQFNQSLERLKQKLKNDSVLFDILNSYASRPMQLATYFCSGEIKDNVKDWNHYALAVPLYTHFTSPLRRYPDIIVHRILATAVEAEKILKDQSSFPKVNKSAEISGRCFTGLPFDKNVAESVEVREALSAAVQRQRVPCTEPLANIAAYCNERNLASRRVKDACDKLYMWATLKKNEFLITNARVMGLGPRFMSVYVHRLAIERRIYYDEVEGLIVEWLDLTSSLILSLCANKRTNKRGNPSKWRAVEEVALVVSPSDLTYEHGLVEGSLSWPGSSPVGDNVVKSTIFRTEIDPKVFPFTVRLLSTIPVVLHPVGGDDGPIDISARLFMSSYLR